MVVGSKLGLALSGGGFTGYLFEIGALTALDDLFEDGFNVNHFDFFVGVSAGSAAAALIANGVRPEEILRANLTAERPYYFERCDIFGPAIGEGFRSIARAIHQLGPVVKLYLRHRREMCLIDVLEKAQETLPAGIYTLEPFARYLEAAFSLKGLSNTFEGLPKALYIPAIDVVGGNTVIFGDEGWKDVPISKAVTASSAAPLYFCPVRIGGRDYIDAGIGRFACFDVATQKAAEFMLMIHPNPNFGMNGEIPRNGTSGNGRHRGFLSIAELATRINLDVRLSLALDLHQREHADKFFIVFPDSSEQSIFDDRTFLSFRDRINLLRCGYVSAFQMVKAQFPRLGPALAQHGISISMAKIEERMSLRMEQFSLGAQGILHRSVERRRKPRPASSTVRISANESARVAPGA
jgi:predicted acylesterase/phospholipase RssA